MISRVKALFFCFFLSFAASAEEMWAVDCDSGVGSITIRERNADLVVNSNQILISTKVVRDGEGMSFYLEEPIDLGRGGMMLHWDDFSTKEKIAHGILRGQNMVFSWKGFFDRKISKYVWVSESDFSAKNSKGDIVMSRCIR